MKSQATDSELRKLVVKACRILFAEGHTDLAGMSGHISARLSSGKRFVIKPVTVGFDEIYSKDLVVGDLNGQKISGRHNLPGETAIHVAIFRSYPEIGSVIHTHPPLGTALSCTEQKLMSLSFPAAFLGGEVPLFDPGTPLIQSLEHGMELASALGGHAAVFLKNHGVVVVGQSVEESTVRAIALENAVRLQLLASSLGSISPLPPGFFGQVTEKYGQSRVLRLFEYAARKARPQRSR